ncbi:thiamine-phosphate kinase [Nodosilinea sp. LEGE 07088]|uniref:thiamine-phosphate kinase n=1 Tax=Nodosilinea sp. LEGE 07088 TaxID=2777968 RepID=UPI001882802C|nr:thiamine-phosphate kinase [Nodosilinea sp. LEGE 07088]MBE9138613.1 thiamine-phosphate kinase [Nodosilinea sp. LEGE 07088]
MDNPQTIAQLGELGLLQRLFRYCPGDMVGDDAAVVALPPGRHLVVTTDVLVDGVHFSDRTTAPTDVGWRAIAANLSDLAAMGATPEGITVGLSLPGHTPIAWVEGLYGGMAACLEAWGGVLLGGDLCRADTIGVAITALGSVIPQRALYRSGAQPGQAILVTGWHGLSRAGLALLLHPETGGTVAAADRDRWIAAHQRPQPRLDAIAALESLLGPGGDRQTLAAMDSSDGLANAVLHLCQASGVGAKLTEADLPVDPALAAWVGPEQARQWCLYGGEDFELVLCLPWPLALALRDRLGPTSAIIGETTDNGAAVELWSDAGDSPTRLSFSQGFQHFA